MPVQGHGYADSIATEEVLSTGRGIGRKSVMDLIERSGLRYALGEPVAITRGYRPANEDRAVVDYERLAHGGESGWKTYLRVSPDRWGGGVVVRVRACDRVRALVRARLLEAATWDERYEVAAGVTKSYKPRGEWGPVKWYTTPTVVVLRKGGTDNV